MPIKKEFRQTRVTCKPGEYYLSVLNPEHPIFRLHSEHTVVIISSSFYEFKDVTLLPENSIVIKITEIQYSAMVRNWARGLQVKSYSSLLPDLQEKIKFLLNLSKDTVLPSNV